VNQPALNGWGPGRFHAISGLRAHEEVIDQITFGVRAGAFRVGDRLPSVEELARAMDVSKPTIGEAIKILVAGGVIAAQRGAGGGLTVISDNIPATLMGLAEGKRERALTELVEARRPIEMEVALLAGQRATEEDFEMLRAAVAQVENARNEPDRSRFMHYDHLLHYAMGRAARSEMLAYYQHQVLEQLFVLLHDYFEHIEDPQIVIDTHRETANALESRNPEKIAHAMDRHLHVLEDFAVERSRDFAAPPRQEHAPGLAWISRSADSIGGQ
jgi:GntR family transcriptional repressor for pyruvate dehydrogenase complex